MKNIGKWVMAIFCISFGIGMAAKNEIAALFLLLLAGCFISPPFIKYSESSREKREGDKYKPAKDSLYWSLSVVMAVIGLIVGVQKPEGKTANDNSKDSHPEMVVKKEEKKWNEGGTLHNCTNAEWKAATKENQLATCADWLVTLATKGDGAITIEQFKQAVTDEQLKQLSENLRAEVDKMVNSGISADDMKGEAASYAAMYWIILKAKVKQEQAK